MTGFHAFQAVVVVEAGNDVEAQPDSGGDEKEGGLFVGEGWETLRVGRWQCFGKDVDLSEGDGVYYCDQEGDWLCEEMGWTWAISELDLLDQEISKCQMLREVQKGECLKVQEFVRHPNKKT